MATSLAPKALGKGGPMSPYLFASVLELFSELNRGVKKVVLKKFNSVREGRINLSLEM